LTLHRGFVTALQGDIMNRALFFCLLFITFSSQVCAQIAFFGRDYDTYEAMFCMQEDSFANKKILDVAAGPSLFLATLKERGILDPTSRAIDLEYSSNRAHLESKIDKGMRLAFNFYYDGSYKNWPMERQTWYEGLYEKFAGIHQSFLGYHDRFPEIFQQGDVRELDLQFDSKKFDLILSSNLLFLYSMDLDEKFHKDAILSMAKVLNKGGEIRITPLDDLKANTPGFLTELVADLEKEGLLVQIKESCAPSTGQWIKRRQDAKGQMLVIRLNTRDEL
jgi:hypothetical protein